MSLKVLAACGAGMGSCQLIAMNLRKAFANQGIDATVTTSNVSNAKSTATNYDVVFCSKNLTGNFKSAEAKGVVVIGLINLISQPEMEQKIKDAIDSGALTIS